MGTSTQQKLGISLSATAEGPQAHVRARIDGRRAAEIWDGLVARLAMVPGTTVFTTVLPGTPSHILQLRDRRRQFAKDVERVLDANPLPEVLTSLLGVGVRIDARFLAETGGDVAVFPAAVFFAAYAGPAPSSSARTPPSAGAGQQRR